MKAVISILCLLAAGRAAIIGSHLELTGAAEESESWKRTFSAIAADGLPDSSRRGTKVRPVIFMHGIFNEIGQHNFATRYIESHVPGARVYPIELFSGVFSIWNLDYQLVLILPKMQEIIDDHSDTGVTMLCYSQGGVICRAAVQMLPNHNVHTLITLSSPLDGQYGVTSLLTPFLPSTDRSILWEFLYSFAGQELSIGDYWNDPHHQEAFSNPKTNILLARLNNQTWHPNSQAYRANFMKLQKLVMIGGPADKVITPWQSAHLGFYNQNENVVPYERQPWYAGDQFGLRTLHEAGKVDRHTIPGIHHIFWHRTAKVYDCCVLPYLS